MLPRDPSINQWWEVVVSCHFPSLNDDLSQIYNNPYIFLCISTTTGIQAKVKYWLDRSLKYLSNACWIVVNNRREGCHRRVSVSLEHVVCVFHVQRGLHWSKRAVGTKIVILVTSQRANANTSTSNVSVLLKRTQETFPRWSNVLYGRLTVDRRNMSFLASVCRP
jgi:hypothetical protein